MTVLVHIVHRTDVLNSREKQPSHTVMTGVAADRVWVTKRPPVRLLLSLITDIVYV